MDHFGGSHSLKHVNNTLTAEQWAGELRVEASDERRQIRVEPVVGYVDQLRVVVQHGLHPLVDGLHGVPATNDGGTAAIFALRHVARVTLR